jgi:hypothetical protein
MQQLIGVVLAHQGGWDEILMVLAPIGLLYLLLRMAKRRAAAPAGVSGTSPTVEGVPGEPIPGSETAGAGGVIDPPDVGAQG